MRTLIMAIVIFMTTNTYAQKHHRAEFESPTYINLGYVFPNMTHVNQYNIGNNALKNNALEMEVSTIWNFQRAKITKLARLGLVIDIINLGYNYYSFQEPNTKLLSKVLTARWSFNVGPNISIRCFKDAYTDIYFKGRATVCYDYVLTKLVPEDAGLGFGFRYSTGINFRWQSLYIGGEAVYGTTHAIQYDRFTADVPDNFMKVKLGFVFSSD